MNIKFSNSKSEATTALREAELASSRPFSIENRKSKIENLLAFSLVEVLLVVSLLSLIVLALMNVFSATQAAFRASITQTDVLEGSRAAMQLITTDLRGITPTGGRTYGKSVNKCGSPYFIATNGVVNFATGIPYGFLYQKLPGSQSNRLNYVQSVFMVSRQNNEWTGVGYLVDVNSTTYLNPLYRFSAKTSVHNDPAVLYFQFAQTAVTNMSHIMDGVLHFSLTPLAKDGSAMNYVATNIITDPLIFVCDLPQPYFGVKCYSNLVPGAVELQLGVLEDRIVQRAESLPNNLPALPPNDRRSLYLYEQSGRVHLFRQIVPIPNVDPTAYQ